MAVQHIVYLSMPGYMADPFVIGRLYRRDIGYMSPFCLICHVPAISTVMISGNRFYAAFPILRC